MGELAQMTGQPVECEIGGKTYKLSPLTVGDFAALEGYIRNKRIAEYRKACDGLDPVIIATGIEHIIKDTVEAAGDNSISTTVYLLWRSLAKSDSKITIEQVGELVTLQNMQEITGVIRALGDTGKNLNRAKVEN